LKKTLSLTGPEPIEVANLQEYDGRETFHGLESVCRLLLKGRESVQTANLHLSLRMGRVPSD